MRYEAPRPIVFGGPLSPGVRTLLFANIGVYVFQLVSSFVAQVRLERLFGLVPYDVVHNLFLWQGVTYLFLHGGFLHILFNMLALYMFGTELEWHWGTSRFLRFYFITGIGAALCSVIVAPNSTIPIIGASGAIYGLLAAYGLLFPDRTLLLYFVIPIKAKYFVLILGAITFWSSLTSSGSGVAHVAHLGGMLFGWLYLRGLPRGGLRNPLPGWRDRWRRERLRRKFKVYYRDTRGGDDTPDEPDA
jgi:membrane associated rhomboid family serine protease